MHPYRSDYHTTIPVTFRERVRKIAQKVGTFIKTYKVPLVCTVVVGGTLYVLSSDTRSCREGAILMTEGRVINCSTSVETLHAKETPQGVFLWCSCPGHTHGKDIP
jgi:hypothetical protein